MKTIASIFKAYDIRGVVGRTIDETFAEHLGRAFGSEALVAGEKAVVVGRDGRLSGPALVAALMRGLSSTGLDVVDLGAVTTPMLYYVAATRGKHGCRSRHPGHRQPQPEGLQRLQDGAGRTRDLWRRHPAPAPAHRGRALLRAAGVARRKWTSVPSTASASSATAKLARRMKIVVDSGNGIPGASAPGILRALGCEVDELYSEVDGDFPEPSPRSEQAGEPGRPDRTRAEHRRRTRPGLRRRRRPPGRGHQGRPDHLPRSPADAVRRATCCRATRARTIIFDVKCSQRLAPAIRAAGGVPLMWKTGHSLIKAKMARDRRADRRRDERPHLLRRALVRLRRRDLHVRRGCSRSCRAAPTRARC